MVPYSSRLTQSLKMRLRWRLVEEQELRSACESLGPPLRSQRSSYWLRGVLQHLKKLMQKIRTAKLRQDPVITGDPQISRRMAHSGISSPKVMLSRNREKPPTALSIKRCDRIPHLEMRRIQVIQTVAPAIGGFYPSNSAKRAGSEVGNWHAKFSHT